MRCPWCGSPVRIKGSRWECGYCGDCGMLARRNPEPEETTLTFSVSISFDIDLSAIWQEMKDFIQTLAPQNAVQMYPALSKAVLYEISKARFIQGDILPDEKRETLESFLDTVSDFVVPFSSAEILSAVGNRVLFADEGELTEQSCGTFWCSLIDSVPESDCPDMRELLSNFGSIYEYFVSDDGDGEAYDRTAALQDAFEHHWYDRKIHHPDERSAIMQLQAGGAKDYNEICRSILMSRFPEAFKALDSDDLIYFMWTSFIEDAINDDPVRGISMWRCLLDAAGTCLKTDADLAEELIPEFIDSDWLYDRNFYYLKPFVDSLEDDTFAEQIFQCAGEPDFRQDLLEACQLCGRQDLVQRYQ